MHINQKILWIYMLTVFWAGFISRLLWPEVHINPAFRLLLYAQYPALWGARHNIRPYLSPIHPFYYQNGGFAPIFVPIAQKNDYFVKWKAESLNPNYR